MEYASHAVGNAALTTGIIGSALGVLGGPNGLMGLLGGRPPMDPGDRPVTRYEMDLHQENTKLAMELAETRANRYTDGVANSIQQEISQQAVWNATQTGLLNCLQNQVQQLYSMTQLSIPNANINPGWGPIDVIPRTVAAATGN